MKIYALIASGKFTQTINGELFTGDNVEVVAAFTDKAKADEMLFHGNPSVKEPAKWGVHTISGYEFEVTD